MTRDQVFGMYAYLEMVHGTTRHVISAFPDDRLDWSPKPGMRTPREIVEHIYGQGLAKSRAVHRGEMTGEQYSACMTAPKSGGTEQLIAWCDETFTAMMEQVGSVTEEQCAAPVQAYFGEFPGGLLLSITYDEWWHHRGQLTVYLRLLDIEVPNIYDYGDGTG